MKVSEIAEVIRIGFTAPKLYKRSVWNQAVKVMEYLSDNTNGVVTRTNSNNGEVKYVSSVELTNEQVELWALQYKRTTGEAILFEDVISELHVIARDLGVKVNDIKVLQEYFNRHPEDKAA